MDKELYLCMVNSDYIKFLHKIDKRVSVKYNNRPYVGLVTMINGIEYMLPLTSQTTSERKKDGKGKRSAMITTFVRDTNDDEIANILHNNMIPIRNDLYEILDIDATVDTYEANEIRFIRKNKDKIIQKAHKVHDNRIKGQNRFLNSTCCDFALLEKEYTNYNEQQKG